MTNIPLRRKPIHKKILFIIVAIPSAFILFIIGSLLLSPLFDGIDKTRFEKLDSESRYLYTELQAVSGGTEKWDYKNSCEDIRKGMGGFYFTSSYACTIIISTRVTVGSLAQLNNLHKKYYPNIDQSVMLRAVSNLDKQLPTDFGVKFVSSSAEKRYTTSDSSIKCTYLADLSDGVNIEYGIDLQPSNAIVSISLRCTDKSRGDWYTN